MQSSNTQETSPQKPVGSTIWRLRDILAETLQVPSANIDIKTPLHSVADSSGTKLSKAWHQIEAEFGVQVADPQLPQSTANLQSLAEWIDQRSQAPSKPHQELLLLFQQQLQAFTQLTQLQLQTLGQHLGSSPLQGPASQVSPGSPQVEQEVQSQKASNPSPPISNQGVTYPETVPRQSDYLNPIQQAHIQELAQQLADKCPSSKTLARNLITQGQVEAASDPNWLFPVSIDKGQGSRIWDVDGNEYVDFSFGFGSCLLGHSPEFVGAALAQQLQQRWQPSPNLELTNQVIQLVRQLTSLPEVLLCDSPSQAAHTALDLACIQTGRTKVAFLSSGNCDRCSPSLPLPYTALDAVFLDYPSQQTLMQLADLADQLAAVVVDPVAGSETDGRAETFLQALRQLTLDHQMALIFDETQTGFRLHPGGAQAHLGVAADLSIFGNQTAAGAPIAVVAGYAPWVSSGPAHHNQDPLALAAAKAFLAELHQVSPQLQTRLNQSTAELVSRLNAHFQQENIPLRLVALGSIFRVCAQQNIDLLFHHLLEMDVYALDGRFLYLSAAHTQEDIDYLFWALTAGAEKLRQAGFFYPSASEDRSLTAHQIVGETPDLTAANQVVPVNDLSDDCCIQAGSRKQVLAWGSSTGPAWIKPPHETLAEWLFAEMTKFTHQDAVFDGTAVLSYAQLIEQAQQFSAQLHELGVAPGHTVALRGEPNSKALVALLAIIHLQAVYLPIELDLEPQQIETILQDSGASIFIDRGQFRVCSSPLNLASPPQMAAACRLWPSQTEAGANLEHSSLIGLLQWLQRHYGLSPQDRMLVHQGLHQKESLVELLWPLTCGAALVLVEPEDLLDIPTLQLVMEERQVSVATMLETQLLQLLQHLDDDLGCPLRLVLVSGWLQAKLGHLLLEKLPHCWLANLAGPAQAGIFSTYFDIHVPTDIPDCQLIPLGKPRPGIQLYALDSSHDLVPPEVIGNLAIGGPAVARTVWPSQDDSKEALHFTEELVFWNLQGQLESASNQQPESATASTC